MKSITLRVDNTGIHYSKEGNLTWEQTNLPSGAFRFRERDEIYWEIRMLGYDPKQAELSVEVLDFEAPPEQYLPDRPLKRPIDQLLFAPLEAEAFKAQLSYYQAGLLKAVLREDGELETTRLTVPREDDFAPPAAPIFRTVRFKFPILDFTFGNGGVKAEVELPGVTELLPFRIANEHLVAEFDAIKPFFVKALKRKTADVKARLEFIDGEPCLTAAASPQIARINENMLEVFRARSVRQLLGADRVNTIDKHLFTPEDVFASLDDDELGKALLPQEGKDLLAEILRHQRVRNARQLEFLAGRLHLAEHKLRYVLSPKFGFVFVSEGQDGRHFILELLNSNATYVWSMPKDWKTQAEQYRAVEQEIGAIGAMGRRQYRSSLHFEHDFWFVIHESAESGVVDGFPRWKNRLLEGLV